jgi:catechol 2,3-dioxygenase-like lactoylglutathione lyase family enzyme
MTIPAQAKTITFIATRDRGKARHFYQNTLGFPLAHEDGFATVFDLHGTMLRISTVSHHTPQDHTVLGWDVSDIAATVRALRAQGVQFKLYEGFEQDEIGIWTAPGSTTKVAWFSDPDGNILSLTQFGI